MRLRYISFNQKPNAPAMRIATTSIPTTQSGDREPSNSFSHGMRFGSSHGIDGTAERSARDDRRERTDADDEPEGRLEELRGDPPPPDPLVVARGVRESSKRDRHMRPAVSLPDTEDVKRRTRSRTRNAAERPLWPLGLAAIALVAFGGWYFFVRDPAGGTGGGRSLASYRPPDIHALAVHPSDTKVVVFGSHRGMLISRDGGKTWDPLGPSGDAMGIAMPPGSKTAFAAGHDVLFRSDDGGQTWASVPPALPGTDIHGFAASAAKPGRFYAFVVGRGLFRSVDGGSTWTRAGTAPSSTMSLAVAKNGDQDVLFASTMEGVQRSRDSGTTWEPVPELGSAYVGASGSRMYAAAGSRVLVSSDGGMRWEQRAFSGGSAALVAPAGTDPDTVYVLAEGFGLWRSTDAGRTWQRMS